MKYYLFIDESGDHQLANYNPTFPVFTLCGILISEDDYNNLQDRINNIKLRHWKNTQIVFHSRDIRKCQNGFEILFDLNIKQQFYEEINAIMEETSFTIISCSILKEKYIKKYGKFHDVYAQSLAFIIEKVVVALSQLRKEKKVKTTELEIFLEKRGKKEDDLLLEYYNKLLVHGTYYADAGLIGKIIKRLHFKWKRENTAGLQLADLIAYPISRYVINPEEVNLPFEILKKKFYQRKDKIHGLKIFPA